MVNLLKMFSFFNFWLLIVIVSFIFLATPAHSFEPEPEPIPDPEPDPGPRPFPIYPYTGGAVSALTPQHAIEILGILATVCLFMTAQIGRF